MKNWKTNSWKKYPVKHIPSYKDEKGINMVLNKLKSSPPLVCRRNETFKRSVS